MKCNICGSSQFGPGPGGRFTANKQFPRCQGCDALERHRVIRRIFQTFPIGFLSRRRTIMLGDDVMLEKKWFKNLLYCNLAAIKQGMHTDLESNSIDCAIMYQILENLPEDKKFIQEILRKLSPRGILVMYLAGMKTRPRCLDYKVDEGVEYHAYGLDFLQTMEMVLAGLHVLTIEETDPCTGVRDVLLLCFKFEGDARQVKQWFSHSDTATVKFQSLPSNLELMARVFEPLKNELSLWQSMQRPCPFWWRDDDLIKYSPLLQQLNDLAGKFKIKVLVGVIPARADDSLAKDTQELDSLVICQHGYQHQSHESQDKPSNEFGAARQQADMEQDLKSGFVRLQNLFGVRFFPVFIPPWNRILPSVRPFLVKLGFVGLSQYPDQERCVTPGLQLVNTHVDILQWSTVPNVQVQPPVILVARIVELLEKRRNNLESEPIGLLTHHRVMREDSWQFMSDLLMFLKQYSCIQWLTPEEVFIQQAAAEVELKPVE